MLEDGLFLIGIKREMDILITQKFYKFQVMWYGKNNANLPPKTYWDWLNKLGISKNLETDLFESTAGQLKSKDIFISQSIEPAVASFGKGFSISPLKLAQLHAVLANGGVGVIPHVTLNFKDHLKNSSQEEIFSEDVSRVVLEWMESVVDKAVELEQKLRDIELRKTGTSQRHKWEIYK